MYRVIGDFKMGYQPKSNILWDEKGDLVTDSQSILARWRNHFSHCSMYMGLVMVGR